MGIIVDIILIAILCTCIFFWYKRGFIGVIVKLFSFIIALVISLILFKPISNLIVEHTSIDDNLKSSISQMIQGDTSSEEESSANIENSSAPTVITNYINTSIEKATQEAKTNIAESVSESLAMNVIHIAVIFLLFIIARIILFFIKKLSDLFTELPIIKQFNTAGGILYGILQGLLIIYIILAIISLFVPSPSIKEAISSSYIGSALYNYNLILMILF